MALQVWLPLDGNVKNQGLTEATLSSGTPTYVAGKIGKCLSTGALVFTVSGNLITRLGSTNIYSMCCWCKDLDTSVGSRWVFQVGAGAGTSRGLWESNSTTYRHWAYNGTGVNMSTSINPVDGNWHHICFTSSGATVTLYIDGVRQSQITNASTTAMAGDQIILTANSYNLNDFRLYDHTLSPQEVKEISRGLVLHYTFGDHYEQSKRNIVAPQYSSGQFSAMSGQFTKTKLADEHGWNYKAKITGNGSDLWPNAKVPNFTFTVGKTYYYSMKVRCNKWTAGTLSLRAARSDNDWVTRSVVVCSSSLADGKWHEYYTYQTINQTYDRSGTTVTCNPCLEVYCSSLSGNGTVYDFDFDVKDIQVIESDFYVPFINNDVANAANGTVHDVSGYNHHGTLTGTVVYDTDTPRYTGCTRIMSNASYIVVSGLTTTGFGNSYSFAWWGKVPSFASPMMWGFSDGVRLNGIYTGRLWNTGDGSNNPLYTPGTTTQVAAPSVNVWHHFVMTGDGTACKLYLDGVLYGQAKTVKSISGTTIYFNGWNAATDYTYSDYRMSDFRIYGTALPADDVLALYHGM